MKYLHSGYIIFCDRADHDDNGMLNVYGIYDVFVAKTIPCEMNSAWVIGFGTPYERRQYKGQITIENPKGELVFEKEFAANDPNDIYKGHYVFRPEFTVDSEGGWVVKVTLTNWKDENMWDIERHFWCMLESATPPDP